MSKSIRFVLISYLMAFCMPLFAQKTQPAVDKETIKAEEQDLKFKMPSAKIKTVKYDNGSVYVGELQKKDRQGYGTLFFLSGDVYRGNWDANSISGQGEMVYVNGDKYVGEWRNGKREGKGTMTFFNGNEYKGEWIEDMYNGQGVFKSKLYSYDGEWMDGKRWGNGTVSFTSGDTYTGQWENDNYNGHGVFTYANRDKYDGEWQQGIQSGQGTMFYANGDKYEGEWIDGQKDGSGKMTFANKDEYEGSWQKNSITGIGTMTYANGDNYIGSWKNGKREGNGTQISAAGDEWNGEWRSDAIYSGEGTIVYSNGRIEEGEWKNGVFINGHRKGEDRFGMFYDGEISQGKPTNGILSYQGEDLTLKGEIKNGEPYFSFVGTLPRNSEYFKPFYTSMKWETISSGSKGGKVSGYNDIVGVLYKEVRKTESRKEREVKERYDNQFHRIVTTLNPYNLNQLAKIAVDGHYVSGQFVGDATITTDFGFDRVIYYENSTDRTNILCITKIAAKLSEGQIVSGKVNITGTLNGTPCTDNFSIRTEGKDKDIFVVISDKYGVLEKSENESFQNWCAPSSLADIIAWLNTGLTRRKSVIASKDAENKNAAEIASITKNKEQWRKNAVRIRDISNSFRNSVAKNRFESGPFAVNVYLSSIREWVDGEHKYRLWVEGEGIYDHAIVIYTNDDSFAKLNYPCRACVYVKKFESQDFMTLHSWEMDGGVYLGQW